MTPPELLTLRLSEVLAADPFILDIMPTELAASVGIPKNSSHGDYAFACFPLAKALRKSPAQIAIELAPVLERGLQPSDPFQSVEAIGPYINLRLDVGKQAEYLIQQIIEGDFLAPRRDGSVKVMIEYSQPNTHKSFHVGHIRNVALGHSLVNQFKWHGYNVVAANYIGDEGTHIAKCLWYLERHFKGQIPEVNRGEFLGAQYAKAVELLSLEALTKWPIRRMYAGRVRKVRPHPLEGSWLVVDLDVGDVGEVTVVTAGCTAVGDLVAYAADGAIINDRAVEEVDKKGIMSRGMLCSASEVGQGQSSDIYQLPSDIPVGYSLVEWFRIEAANEPGVTVEELLARRETEVRQVLQRLEAQEPDVHTLWKKTREWSLDSFTEVYEWLGAPFDHVFYESEVSESSKQIVLDAYEKGALEKSQGAIGARLEGLPFFLLLKSDGTGLYSTKDIALAQRKFDEFDIDKSIYVVDQSQSLHFQQVFATLKHLGYERASDSFHLAYGMVVLPSGKMSSRKGTVVLFSDLRKQVIKTIREQYLERFRGNWTDEEIDDTARKVAVATIYYGMLNQSTHKDIVFDLGEWSAPTGRTGPYMLYAVARVRSILRKAVDFRNEEPDYHLLGHETERELLLQMHQFPKITSQALTDYRPQTLCTYAYELARTLNRHNKHCPILKAESSGLREARLQLIDAATRVLDQTLSLLAIESVERM